MSYKLVICEIHIPDLHGYMETSSKNICMNFIVTTILSLEEFYTNDYLDDIAVLKECYNLWLIENARTIMYNNIIIPESYNINHPHIRNYINIITNNNYIKIDIAYVEELQGGEMVAYIKTFWLRIIQRKWKKIYRMRSELIKKRKLLKSIKYRNLYGKWPKGLCNIPKLCGILNKI